MLYTDGEDHICNYDIFIPQGHWSKEHVLLWAEHFNRPLKTRNKAMTRAFEKENMRLTGIYPFLDESQILGKTFTKFYIPNICGKISKNFLRKYASSKRYQKKIGNFDLKTPYLVLRQEPLLKASKEAFNKPSKTFGEVQNKRSNGDSSFLYSYDFYEDETFSRAKISVAHTNLEISTTSKNKILSINSVQNNVNKENLIPNNTNDIRSKSILKEKDDQIIKKKILPHDDSELLENTNLAKCNNDFMDLNSSVSQFNTKPNIKKSVRFNDTKLCTYESSQAFNTESSQNSTVPTETELLFDLFVKRGKQIEKKNENYISDNLERLSDKSSDDLSLNISTEKYTLDRQNQISIGSQKIEIDSTTTTTNTSTVDFILPTSDTNIKSISEFGKTYARDSTNTLEQVEVRDINVIDRDLNQDLGTKNTATEINSDADLFKMNTLNATSDKYMINKTFDYNCNLESNSNIKQQMEIDEIGHFERSNKLEKTNHVNKINTSNGKIPMMISESDTTNASTINFISPTPETNDQNKNELCDTPTYKCMSSDKLNHDIHLTESFVDKNKLNQISDTNMVVSLVINEKEISNQETNVIPVESKEKEQANNFPESDLECSSESSGRVYEDHMYSQDFTNDSSVEISQKELDVHDSVDSQQVKEINHPNKDKMINSLSNSIIYDSWEQSNINRNIVCSSVDDDTKLSSIITENNMYLTGDEIHSGQHVSLSNNSIITNKLQEAGSDEIFESQNVGLENIKLDEFASHNYLTPKLDKHNDKQLTEAPKKDDTKRMCDNTSPIRTVKTLENEGYRPKGNSDNDEDHNEQIDSKLRKNLFSLPNESESSESLLYYGDILLDSQMLSVNLKPLLKHPLITCNIDYKTHEGFEENLNKENEAKSVAGRNNNADNKIKENNTNMIVASENLEGTTLINENPILHGTCSNDFETLFQQNSKKPKLLSNYVSEHTIQTYDPLMTSIPSPEDPNDFIMTPNIEMPLKRKKRRVRQNRISEALSSPTQDNEACFTYNKKKTESNHVIQQQPDLSSQDQQINFLHTGVGRQSLENIDKGNNSNVYLIPTGLNEINICTTTEDSIKKVDEMVNDRNRYVVESKTLITNRARESKEDSEGTSSQTDLFRESKFKSSQKIQGIKEKSVTVSEHLVTDIIKRSLDNKDTESHEDILEQTNSTTSSRQRKKHENVVASESIVTSTNNIRKSVDNIKETDNHEDILHEQKSLTLRGQVIRRKKHQNMVTSESIVTSTNNIRQFEKNIKDIDNHEEVLAEQKSLTLTGQDVQRKKHLNVVTSKPIVTGTNNRSQSVNNIENKDKHRDFLDEKTCITLSSQDNKKTNKVTSKPAVNSANILRQSVDDIEDTGNHDDFFVETDSRNLSRRDIKTKTQESVVSSDPTDTNIVRQSVDNIEDTDNQEDILEKTNFTTLSRRDIQMKKQRRVVLSDPIDTNIVRQSVDNIESNDNQEDFLETINSTTLLRRDFQTKKQRNVVSSDPIDTNIGKQSVDNIGDTDNQEDFLEKNTYTTLSRRDIQTMKLRSVVSDPIDTNIVRKSMDNIENTNNQENFFVETHSETLSWRDIQTKKQQRVLLSDPIDTNVVRQSVNNIEENDNQEDLFVETDSGPLSRRDILTKKQQRVLLSDPIDTSVVRQSVNNIEEIDNQENLFVETDSGTLSRRDIQTKKQQHVLSSDPIDTKIVRQSVNNIEDNDNQEDFFAEKDSGTFSRRDIQTKKQRRVLLSVPLDTNIVRQSVNIEDNDNQEDFLEKPNSKTSLRRDFQTKKQRNVVSSDPIHTNIVKQSVDNIEGTDNEEDFLEKTNYTTLSRGDIQTMKLRSVVSDPINFNTVRKSVDNIENTDNQEDFFAEKDCGTLSRRDIQMKTQRSVVSSDTLVTNVIEQSVDNIENMYNQEKFLEETDCTTLLREDIQMTKRQSVTLSEPLVTNSVKQYEDNFVGNKDFISGSDTITSLKQELNKKKYRHNLRSKLMGISVSRESLNSIDNVHNHDDLSELTESAISPRKEIQRKKRRTILTMSEPLIADVGNQPMYEAIDYHDGFSQIDSNSLSSNKFKKKKLKSVKRSEPVINRTSLQAVEKLGSESRQSITQLADTFNDQQSLSIPSLSKNSHLTNTNPNMPGYVVSNVSNRNMENVSLKNDSFLCRNDSEISQCKTTNSNWDTFMNKRNIKVSNKGLPIESKFTIDNNLPSSPVVSQGSSNSYSGKNLNIQEYFLNNGRQRHLLHQTKLKSRNPLLSKVSSSQIVHKKYTPVVQEKENLPFTSIITSYSNNRKESNSDGTSPLQTMHNTLGKNRHLIYSYSQTTSQGRSSPTGAEEYLSIQNSNENQLLSSDVSVNEWDINLLSEEDLQGSPDSQKISTASPGNSSFDGRITNTVWSDSNTKSSSAGGAYGFDFDLPSYDENSFNGYTSSSNSIATDNAPTDDPWLDF